MKTIKGLLHVPTKEALDLRMMILLLTLIVVGLMITVVKVKVEVKSGEMYFNNKRPMVVISESMEPAIMTNGFVMVEARPYDEIEVGDVIVAEVRGQGLVVHRVIEKDQGVIKTKGDNNRYEDPWEIREEDYKGRVEVVYNGVSEVFTYFFKDGFKEMDLIKIFKGFIGIALLISAIILMIYWLYEFTATNILIERAYKEEALGTYYSWMTLRVTEEKVGEQIEKVKKTKGVCKIYERYRLMKLGQLLDEERDVVKRIDKKYRK